VGKKRIRKRQPVLFYVAEIDDGALMRRFVWIMLIFVLISVISGCARTKRIANDVDWIILDGEPSKDN